MDFASLLVPGAAPAVDTTALLGAPPTAPADGDAFADLFAQAMVALPTGEAAPSLLASTAPAAGVPALPTVDLRPDASDPASLGAPAAPPALGSPVLPPFVSNAPTEDAVPVEPNEAASEPNPGVRSHATGRTGKKGGVPTLPDCPTAPLLPNCPTAPLLPSCPPAPAGLSAPDEGGGEIDGGKSKDASAWEAEKPLAEEGASLLAAPTAAASVLVPDAPARNATATVVAVPTSKDESGAEIAAVGTAAKPAATQAVRNEAPPTLLPTASDLGIVPQVTVTAFDPETSAASNPNPAPTAPETLPATPMVSPAPVPSSPAIPQAPPAAAPTAAAPAAPVAAKDEAAKGAKVESVKGREAILAPKAAVEPDATKTEAKAETRGDLAEPVLEIAVQERKDDGQAPSGDASRDAHPKSVVPESVVPGAIENGVRETAATARPEAGADRPAVDRHLVVKQVADRIENMVAARPRDGVTIHMEPRDLGTVTLVVKGLASALDVQVSASDDRVRQSLDASRPELAQALAPRGIGIREIRVEHAPSTGNSPSSTTADSGSGSSQNRSGSGSQPPPKQNPSAFRSAAPSPSRPRPARATGRGVDLLV